MKKLMMPYRNRIIAMPDIEPSRTPGSGAMHGRPAALRHRFATATFAGLAALAGGGLGWGALSPGWRGVSVWLAAALICLIPGRALWAANAAIPYARLAGFGEAFNAIPVEQRNRIQLAVHILHEDAANHAPIHAWMEAGGTRTEIALAADGSIDLPNRPDWAADDAMLQTDQPAHTLKIGVDVLVVPPKGLSMPVRDMLDAMKQGNAAVRAGARHFGGLLAILAAPVSDSVDIKLAECCGGTASLRDGANVRVMRQSPQGDIAIPAAMLQAAPEGVIVLSAPVVRIGLFTD
jgi:hypothetical protein